MLQIEPMRPNIERLTDCINRLDSWDCTGPDRELDCRIAYALGREWTGWRALCENEGFDGAWLFEPVFDGVVPRYTSSYDAIMEEISLVMPEADQMSWTCDPSGCGATVGVWNLSSPTGNQEDHQPFIWPLGKGYANTGLHAMLRAFLEAVRQREGGATRQKP